MKGPCSFTGMRSIFHLAVADLDAERDRMVGAGIEATPLKEFERDGEMLARFFFVQDPDGYKIEVLERSGHYV